MKFLITNRLESYEEELLDVVGNVDCKSGLINNDNSDQLHIAIPFSIIDESDNSNFVHISNEIHISVIKIIIYYVHHVTHL